MELHKLRALHAVVAGGSFRAGAAALDRSPSSISASIRELEADIGTPLLTRTTRSVTLTPAGRTLIDGTYGTIEAIDRAAAHALRVGTTAGSRIRIGHSGASALLIVRTAVQALLDTDPGLSLQISEGSTADLVGGLLADRLDLALVHPPLHEESLEEELLSEEVLVAVVPSTHPLAKNKTINLADLADTPFILPPRSAAPAVYDRVLDACRTHGHFRPISTQEASTIPSALALIAAGAGTALLPRGSGTHPKTLGITSLRLRDPLPRLPLHLAWRRHDTNPALLNGRAALLASRHRR